jgi:hypothetical protein
MSEERPKRLTRAEVMAEAAVPLPSKEVISLLDIRIDADLALALAAPIDLAVAANANVAAPIDAAVSANVLSFFSSAAAVASQDVVIDQYISGEAIANAEQTAAIDQTAADGGGGEAGGNDDLTDPILPPPDVGDDLLDPITGALSGGLLKLDVDLAVDVDVAAPIAGAVAANANVAVPIDAAVAANIGSVGSEAIAIADQTAVITQELDDVVAEATVEQESEINQ